MINGKNKECVAVARGQGGNPTILNYMKTWKFFKAAKNSIGECDGTAWTPKT